MTKEEFLTYTAVQIRNNQTLMDGYIQLFKETFNSVPNCAGCTFNSDYQKLKNHLKKNNTMSENKTVSFEVNPQFNNQIIRVNGKAIYLKNATDEQINAYLSEKGKNVDLNARKAKFKSLPKTDLNDLKVSELKKLAEEKGIEGFDSLKKQELIDVLS